MKFDQNTLAQVGSINKLLASELTKQAQILTQYGGDPTKFSNARIQEAEETAFQLRGLIAEFVQLQRGMNTYLAGENTGSTTPNAQQQTMLYQMQQNPQNFVDPSK